MDAGLCAPNEVALHGFASSVGSGHLSGYLTALSVALSGGQFMELQVPSTRPLEPGDIVNFDVTGL